MKYIDRHIEEVFKPYEDTPAELLQALNCNDKRYRMKTIKSGRMLESESYPLWNSKTISKAKKIIKEYDAELRKLYYQKTRRKNVERLLQSNFTEKDMWIHLTYRDGVEPQNHKEAYNDIKNYIKRLQRVMTKKGWGKLKYVYVIEGSINKNGTRYHLHVVTNFPDLDIAKAKWKKGKYPQTDRLTPDEDIGLKKMAKYLTKEVDDEDKPTTATKKKKTYGYSLGLHKPWILKRDGGSATISDSRMTRARAEKLKTGRIDPKAFFEKMYKGFEFYKMEVKTSDYASGYYIYVRMYKRIE